MRANAVVDISLNRLSSRVDANSLMEFTGAVKRVLKDPSTNKTRNEQAVALDSLRTRQCIFMQSDKSKRLVALDQGHYDQLLRDHTGGYDNVHIPLPSTIQARFNRSLASIARSYSKETRDALERQKCSEPLPSVMRALPKDNKEGELKARPIVAAVDAPATNLSRYIAGIAFPLIQSFIQAHIGSTE